MKNNQQKISIKLYNGDCLTYLKTIKDKSIDMILQDPPYNTTACKWEWDIMTKIDEFWAEWKRVIKDNGVIVMTASQPFTSKLIMSNLKMFKYEWIWEKEQGVNFLMAKKQPMKVHENIIVFGGNNYFPQMTEGKPYTSGKGNSGEVSGKVVKIQTKNKGIRYPKSIVKIKRETGLHPTQKPVALMEYLIKTYTNEGDTVFDGFMGSGTTGVACKNLNRNFIGCELDEKYFKIAQDRINNTPDKLI